MAGALSAEFKQPIGLAVTLLPLILPGTEDVGKGDEVPVRVLLAVGCATLLEGLKVGHKLMGTCPIETSAHPAGS